MILANRNNQQAFFVDYHLTLNTRSMNKRQFIVQAISKSQCRHKKAVKVKTIGFIFLLIFRCYEVNYPFIRHKINAPF